MPPAVHRKQADPTTRRDGSSSVHSDIRRIRPRAAPGASQSAGTTGESAEFREAIAYMKGVADAIALVASAPPEPPTSTTTSRRVTLPYSGPRPSSPADDAGDAGEPASAIRLRVALPCPELYDLAGVDRNGTE
jgi:hypothetical protein